MEKVAIIIPAFNEEDSIAHVLNELNDLQTRTDFIFDCVVINDRSSDKTGKIAEQFPCTVLHMPIQCGIGGAVQTGLKYALANNYNYAIQLDGDGQHIPAEIPKLMAGIELNLDVVIGSRFIDNTGFQSSFMRRIGINYFKLLNRLLIGVEINDNTSGFRLFNKKALLVAAGYYPDEYPEPETIVLFTKAGLKIGEVSVKMRERIGGKSSIGFTKSIYYIFKVTLAIIFSSLKNKKA